MATGADERERAIAAADGTCPRCGATREPDQRYCLECGLALPIVDGQAARAAATVDARVSAGIPGDWVWISLADAGRRRGRRGRRDRTDGRASRRSAGQTFKRLDAGQRRRADRSADDEPRGDGRHVDAPDGARADDDVEGAAGRPEERPLRLAAQPERLDDRARLVPEDERPAEALATATGPPSHGLHQVGILDSSRYASLQPGYLVVFTGIYGSRSDADAAVGTARQAGFGGAYSRQIAR